MLTDPKLRSQVDALCASSGRGINQPAQYGRAIFVYPKM